MPGPATPDRGDHLPDDHAPDAGELLVRAAHQLRRRWMASLEPWGVSPHELRALRTVAGGDEPRLADLAERLRIAPRSATEVVDALEAKELVERVRSEHDRRAVLVRLTERGHEVLAEVGRRRTAVGTDMLAALTPAEQETLRTLLAKVAAADDATHPA